LPLATRFFPEGTAGVKQFGEDAWVDIHITSLTTSCKSANQSSRNSSSWNRCADMLSTKRPLVANASFRSAAVPSTSVAATLLQPSSVEAPKLQDAALPASIVDQRLALETRAVWLSLVLAQSGTESGARRCWQRGKKAPHMPSSVVGPRTLRPITITFAESQGSAPKPPSFAKSTLVKSLKELRLHAGVLS
jgi:hypothetical protein